MTVQHDELGRELGDSARFGVTAPRQARSKEVLTRVLDATTGLLAERSFGDIRLADILLAADVSSSSFYMRFRNKEAVLHVLFDRYYDESRVHIEELTTLLAASDDLEDALGAVIGRYVEFIGRNEPLRRAFRGTPELAARHLRLDAAIGDAVGSVAGLLADTALPAGSVARVRFASEVVGQVLQASVRDGIVQAKLQADEGQIVRWLTEMLTLYVSWVTTGQPTAPGIDLRDGTRASAAAKRAAASSKASSGKVANDSRR